MANTPSGTVLAYTVDIVKDLLASGNAVDANVLGDLISNFGDRLLEIKHKEEGVIPAEAPVARATPAPAPAATPVKSEEAKPAEAPAPAATTQAPHAQADQPAKGRGRKSTPTQAATKRKPGRPKGSGRKAAEAQTGEAEAVSEVLTGEVIPPEAADAPEAAATEETITEFNNPDPKAPDYKFKHLLDRFGTNPDGSAKRFNNMTEEDTFDGEIVISLFDGTKRKMLKRHLGTDYSMTVPEYVTHFGLSKGYRPVGKDFSASKSVDAKKTKLGHKPEEAEAAPEQPIATPVKAVRRTRARAAQEA